MPVANTPLPRSSNQTLIKPRAKALFIPKGSRFGFDMENIESLTATISQNTNDYPTFEDDTGVPHLTETDTLEASLQFNMRSYGELVERIANLSQKTTFVQPAATGSTYTVAEAIYEGAVFGLTTPAGDPVLEATITDAKIGEIPLVLGTDYAFDPKASLGKLFRIPEGADAADGLTVTYDQEEVSTPLLGGYSQSEGLDGVIIVRDTNSRGIQRYTRFNNVNLKPDGDRTLIGEGLRQTTLAGRIYGDPSRPAGRTFYEVIHLKDVLSAASGGIA